MTTADARYAARLSLMGVKAAARALKVRPDVVEARAQRAEAAAAVAEAAWKSFLLAECIRDGVTDINDASPVTVARARRRWAAALAAPKAHDPLTLFAAADNVFSARCRRALDWMLLHYGRESPNHTVKVGDQYVTRIDLGATPAEICRTYELYTKQHNEEALSRSSFMRDIILPQMKPRTSMACLCSHCEDGREAIAALKELMTAPKLFSALGIGDAADAPESAVALSDQVGVLAAELHAYSHDVTKQLQNDEPDVETFTCQLRFADVLAQPVAALDGLCGAIDAVASKTKTKTKMPILISYATGSPARARARRS